MLEKIIDRISNDYISEANRSPTLIEDMAAMEMYMAESYSGRIFIELLQNADDCGSTKIMAEEYKGNIIFANNGRPFDENDIIAISRSGASKKDRGTSIGYRGIGFKSTAYLSSEIIIYSNSTYFTFSKSKCAHTLNKPTNKIPTVRIPFLAYDVDQNIKDHIIDLTIDGFTTVFVFKNAKLEQFKDELLELNNGYFVFLHNICSCVIDICNVKTCYKLKRKTQNGYKLLNFEGRNKEDWLVIDNGKTSLAMKYINGRVVPCETEEALFHCFLPTLDKTPFLIKINADFSTDPSRKHITLDSLTLNSIDSIASLLFEILNQAMIEKNIIFSHFLDIISSAYSFSIINQKLISNLDKLIKSKLKLETAVNGKLLINKCKLLPDSFENSEKQLLRRTSRKIAEKSLRYDYYEAFPNIDDFVAKYSTERFSSAEIAEILIEKDCVEQLNSQTYAKVLSCAANSVKTSKFSNEKAIVTSDILIPTNHGIVSLNKLENSINVPNEEYILSISETLSDFDIITLCGEVGISRDIISKQASSNQAINNNYPERKSTIIKSNRPVVAKWRSAEQQCIELEKYFGNNAIDVSRHNIGYDVDSTMPNGEKRYIEVKLLSSSGGPFSMTNNEYTAAHQYGDKYYIFLIMQNDTHAKVIYINNPLKNLFFEKRVRQWEWLCESYTGEEFSIDLV